MNKKLKHNVNLDGEALNSNLLPNAYCLLPKKVKSSSIAEVVIALTIIAICFGVASLIFIRSMSVTAKFEDIKHQTEIQSEIMESLILDNDSIPLIQKDNVETVKVKDLAADSLQQVEFLGFDERVIWRQEVQ